MKDLSKLSLRELEECYLKEHSSWPKMLQAEVLYALAVALFRASKKLGFCSLARGRKYARECAELLKTMPCATIAEVTPTYLTLVGVPVPHILHYGVVMDGNSCRDFCRLLEE